MAEQNNMDAEVKATIEKLDRLQRQDHDTLIRVEVATNDIRSDIKELKDGVKSTITDHENRLIVLEKAVTAEKLKDFDSLVLWHRDFVTRWKFILGISSAVGAIVSFIVTFLSLIALSGGQK